MGAGPGAKNFSPAWRGCPSGLPTRIPPAAASCPIASTRHGAVAGPMSTRSQPAQRSPSLTAASKAAPSGRPSPATTARGVPEVTSAFGGLAPSPPTPLPRGEGEFGGGRDLRRRPSGGRRPGSARFHRRRRRLRRETAAARHPPADFLEPLDQPWRQRAGVGGVRAMAAAGEEADQSPQMHGAADCVFQFRATMSIIATEPASRWVYPGGCHVTIGQEGGCGQEQVRQVTRRGVVPRSGGHGCHRGFRRGRRPRLQPKSAAVRSPRPKKTAIIAIIVGFRGPWQ